MARIAVHWYRDPMEHLRAEITITEIPDGPLITIDYEDGHVVRLKCDPDSIVVRMHLGIDKGDE